MLLITKLKVSPKKSLVKIPVMLPLPAGKVTDLKSANVLVLKTIVDALSQLSKIRSPSNSSDPSPAYVKGNSPSTSLRLN